MSGINKIGRDMSVNSVNLSRAVDKKAVSDTFKAKLDSLEQEEIRIELNKLYGQIEVQTNKLQDSLFIEDLISYKKLIKEFLDIAVNNSHVFFKKNSLDRRGRHRIFSLVKKVDIELDELTKEFIDIESNRIKILNKLNTISGMLMDILT